MTERRSATATSPRPVAKPRQQESTMTDSDTRLAELEVRISQLETQPNLRERGRGVMARIVPADASRHFRNAGREQLLGIRSIVDFWIRRIDESEEDRPGPRRESIEIE
jgi:hypothetical protein